MRGSTFAEEVTAEERADGESFGLVKGETRGRVAALLEVLESRFGAVPADVGDKIKRVADLDALRAWLRAVGSSTNLSDFRTKSGL